MIFTLILSFICKIYLPENKPISRIIRRKFGQETLDLFRQVENTWRRFSKVTHDLHFLNCCKTFNVFPSFLRFKLFRKDLYNSELYKDFQRKLLDTEINDKKKNISHLRSKLVSVKSNLRESVSFLTYLCLIHFIQRGISKTSEKIRAKHKVKIEKIGGRIDFKTCDSKSVLFNFSDYNLSSREKLLLSLGLDFKLPAYKPDFYRYFLEFEIFLSRMKRLTIRDGKNFSEFCDIIKFKAKEFLNSHKRDYCFSPIIERSDLKILRSLGKVENVQFCRTDKGRGLVLFNKSEYISKIQQIISDPTKFMENNSNVFPSTIGLEDKVNRFLSKIKKQSIIDEDQYKQLYVTGASPGILYGLAKIHKPGVPLRPILAAYNTPTYKLSKFIIPLIDHLASNSFSLKNSYNFVEQVKSLYIDPSHHMVSFDVKSLYTNVPVIETIDLICNKLFCNSDNYAGFSKSLFREMLVLAITNSNFLFNKNYYSQIDGLAMGNPIAPTLANIFLCGLETTIMDKCPADIKPIYYRRYLDDIFAIFKCKTHSEKFFEFINLAHNNIEFSIEEENENTLNFLDLLITKDNHKTSHSVYRKPTFTNLGTSFFSFIPFGYKLSIITTLVTRAYRLSSNFHLFHDELEKLRAYFSVNGYPPSVVESRIRLFLGRLYKARDPIQPNSEDIEYFKFPYLGEKSYIFQKFISKLLKEFYPSVNFKLIFSNDFKISSFLKLKEGLPSDLRSNIIYKYECNACQAIYVGSTSRQSKIRFYQHLGISHRTGIPLKKPVFSSIRSHSENKSHELNLENFKILTGTYTNTNLRTVESLYIKILKPSLNSDQSSCPLLIF